MSGLRVVLLASMVALPLSFAGAQEEEAPRGTRAQPPDVPPGSAEGLQGDIRSPENPPGSSSPGERQGFPGTMAPAPEPSPLPPQAAAQPEPMPVEPPPPPEPPAQPPAPDRGQLAQPAPSQQGGATGAPAQPKPVGSPPPPPEGVQAMVAAEPELVARSQVAREQLETTEVALAAGRVDEALLSLEQANEILSDLYTTSRGARLAMDLGDAASSLLLPTGAVVDLRPLVSQIDEVAALVPPDVVARVQVAARAQRNQRSAEAAAALLEARETLMADLGLRSVEEVYARSRAAAAEIDAGRPDLARALLHRTIPVLAQWQAEAPLVPIRLNLRAAAHAAESRNWARAEVWLNNAAAELGTVQANAPRGLSRQLAPLAAQLSWLQERLAAGKQPGPRQFRVLAKSATVPAG